jgi:hypothetical protein
MKRKSNLLIIAVPLIIVLCGYAVYEYGYLRVQEEIAATREMEMVKTRTLEKYVTLIAEKPGLEARIAQLKDRKNADASKLIEAQTLSLGAAKLQETLKGIITGRGGTISSERVEKPDELGKYRTLNVAIDAIVPDARALTDILYGIETRTPYLIVRELDTRVRNFRDPRELMVKIRVSGLTSGK